MLLRAQFRALVVDQLRSLGVVAADQIHENRSLPLKPDELPAIIVATPGESKTSRGRGAPKFDTVIGLEITVKVSQPTAETAMTALEHLVERIELAILANTKIVNVCQQFVSVETRSDVDTIGGSPIATATLRFTPELYQTYDPCTPDRLLEIQATFQDGTQDFPMFDAKF